MADRRLQNPAPNKMAMSRALGAAFLNHQVEQLEKSVSANSPSNGNWRDRKHTPSTQPNAPPQFHKRTPMAPGIKIVHRKKGGDVPAPAVQSKAVAKEAPASKSVAVETTTHKATTRGGEQRDRDADIVVVDASVLVHALYQLKKWSRDGRKEIIIVPLEGQPINNSFVSPILTCMSALNTLDLLKKGTSPLAQRARAASRVLEAQVGTNPRVRVQNDEAFVLWDRILMDTSSDDESDGKTMHSPEWVRRTICCARWEVDNASATVRSVDGDRSNETKKPKVAIAVLSGSPNLSPLNQALKLADSNDNTMTPVPLPAPSVPHAHKF
ncbi:hypothetical protein NP233_g9680 [Leucocoprinus birnbaumii]|uniref:PIN domain-containing protein n=1 Tax=Leucocoprinus birnbaumii TaxID=56174 RepID=A0AAD5VLP9_9AGAR|nr:hypothetical protein NP233_g9680 [Leucocoprinus birnbaumii]